jgi:hypothetical protein
MGVAFPVNEGNGSNVTVPFALAVYVPSPVTVSDEPVHEPLAVDVVHSFTGDDRDVPVPAVSLESGVMVWFVS